jgi:predicted permease
MPLAYLIGNALFWWLTKRLLWQVDIRTRAAATLCATQKSLSFGLPFIRATFGHRADLAEIMAPLLIFNTVQLFFGATTVVPILKHNIRRHEKKKKKKNRGKNESPLVWCLVAAADYRLR